MSEVETGTIKITGWRRLIFGMYSASLVAGVEVYKEAGWTYYGAAALIGVVAFFYGERMVDSLKGLVEAIKSRFGKSDV